MSKRTTHRSAKGTKVYAVRGGQGQFKDIQTYKRAHGSDIQPSDLPETSKKSTDELRKSSKRFSRAMSRLAKR
jgi:hypothetical protein